MTHRPGHGSSVSVLFRMQLGNEEYTVDRLDWWNRKQAYCYLCRYERTTNMTAPIARFYDEAEAQKFMDFMRRGIA